MTFAGAQPSLELAVVGTPISGGFWPLKPSASMGL